MHGGDPCAAGGDCADACNEVVDSCNEAVDVPCSDDGDVCTVDACDGGGACLHTLDPDLGPSCNLCPAAPEPGCLGAAKATFSAATGDDASSNKLSWKWQGGDASPFADFGNPDSDDWYRLCLYSLDDLGTTTALSGTLVLPGPLWTGKPGKSWTCKDKDATSGGISLITLKAGDVGKGTVTVRAKGASVQMPGPAGSEFFAPTTTVIVQVASGAGRCWGAAFRADDMKLNTAAKAKIVDLLPFCGDGVRDYVEACDLADDLACPGNCDVACACVP